MNNLRTRNPASRLLAFCAPFLATACNLVDLQTPASKTNQNTNQIDYSLSALNSAGPITSAASIGYSWSVFSMPPQNSDFTVEWDAVPNANAVDGVMSFSSKSAITAYSDNAVLVRFANSGFIEARNGSAYSAASSIRYFSGTSYHFRVAVKTSAKTFSAFVKPAGGAEVVIGQNFAFRTEQASTTQFASMGAVAGTIGNGTFSIKNAAVTVVPMVTPPPSSTPGNGVKPTASNTGPKVGMVLKKVTGFKAQSNTVYEGLDILGGIDLRGLSNVTLRNCRINANGSYYAVRVDDTVGKNRVIENCELYNMSSAAIYGDNFTARFNNVHDSGGDGFKTNKGGTLIEYNFVHTLGTADGAHADGVQIRGANGVIIRYNNFYMPINVAGTHSNAALFLQLATNNVEFSHNWTTGGNYTISAFSDADTTSIKILNNRHTRNSARFGYGHIAAGTVWLGNVYDDDGSVATTKAK